MSRPLVSVGIPLFRSGPFVDGLRANCRALAARDDVEVIVSDRHGLDDTIDLLAAEWKGDPRFRFLKASDGLSWVEHANLLLRAARGEYFRWMPHDDLFPEGCLDPLVDRLNRDPEIILAYAPTRAIDSAGHRLPERDRLETCPVAFNEKWTLRHSLDLFWTGSCDGAFKGLFRRLPVIAADLFIRPTRGLIFAERGWLFGISLLGGLAEEPGSQYFKRYHPASTHAGWSPGIGHVASATAAMCGYLKDYGPGWPQVLRGMATLWMRAARHVAREARTKKR